MLLKDMAPASAAATNNVRNVAVAHQHHRVGPRSLRLVCREWRAACGGCLTALSPRSLRHTAALTASFPLLQRLDLSGCLHVSATRYSAVTGLDKSNHACGSSVPGHCCTHEALDHLVSPCRPCSLVSHPVICTAYTSTKSAFCPCSPAARHLGPAARAGAPAAAPHGAGAGLQHGRGRAAAAQAAARSSGSSSRAERGAAATAAALRRGCLRDGPLPARAAAPAGPQGAVPRTVRAHQ